MPSLCEDFSWIKVGWWSRTKAKQDSPCTSSRNLESYSSDGRWRKQNQKKGRMLAAGAGRGSRSRGAPTCQPELEFNRKDQSCIQWRSFKCAWAHLGMGCQPASAHHHSHGNCSLLSPPRLRSLCKGNPTFDNKLPRTETNFTESLTLLEDFQGPLQGAKNKHIMSVPEIESTV